MVYTALKAGIPFDKIETMSVDEIALVVQVKQEQDEEEIKKQAWLAYNEAALTAVAINNPKKFPKIEEAFPRLFEKKSQQDWRAIKARMENFAKAKNGTTMG